MNYIDCRKKTLAIILIGIIAVTTGCDRKKNLQNLDTSSERNENKVILEKSESYNNSSHEDNESKLKLEIENAMKAFIPAIEFYTEYDFLPISTYDIKLINLQLQDNNILVYYDGNLLYCIEDFDNEIEQIYNNCIPYRDDRLYSCSFDIQFHNFIHYFGIINLEKGKIKIYKSLQSDYQNSPPFYSGNTKFFIVDNVRKIKEKYYNYKTFKNEDAIYGGFIELYDFSNNELVYKIDKRQLHSYVLYDIDKIGYEGDDFSIRLGNCYDSDEFVDFKLFTDNDNFKYEIYDKYSYSDDE